MSIMLGASIGVWLYLMGPGLSRARASAGLTMCVCAPAGGASTGISTTLSRQDATQLPLLEPRAGRKGGEVLFVLQQLTFSPAHLILSGKVGLGVIIGLC